jgi:hypothetical protein
MKIEYIVAVFFLDTAFLLISIANVQECDATAA